MTPTDFLRLTTGSVRAQPVRSLLTSLGIAIGIAAVVLLTSIGEGIHRFVLSEFTQFGTNLITVQPGKATTFGGSVGAINNTRPLTFEDAASLTRLASVLAVEPVTAGNAVVEAGTRQRRTNVNGVGTRFPEVFSFGVAAGQFLPPDNPRSPRAFAVLGSTLKKELFGDRNPLGEHVRIGGNRFLVVGIMESKGQVLGFDIDDGVYIPTAKALELFNREGLMEIDVLYRPEADADQVAAEVRRALTARHGNEDFTIITQQQMLDVLGSVLGVLTFAVAALGSISLLVGAVGILTIMTIAVRERTAEIGLLRALGARQGQVLALFLGEATVLSGVGGLGGLALGVGIALLLQLAVPALPVHINWSYVIAAEALSLMVGLAAGTLPARRAALLDHLEALRAE